MNPLTSPLLTDLYQFTMLQGYIDQEMHDISVFEFSVRSMPDNRNFFITAGLESVLEFLEQCHFSQEELKYLADTGRFSQKLLDYLERFDFSGSVHAMAEGTIFFPHEPIIRITAPLPEAQLIESRVINLLHYQSLIASKAARCVIASDGRANLIDFGLRRTHGAEAGLFAARSTYIAGFIGTSTVLAESLYGIPIFGTMAHSFIEAQKDEQEAFINFAYSNPGNVTLLIDTYDTVVGAQKVIETAHLLREKDITVRGVRLDSGDIPALSKEVRAILDKGGLEDVGIFVSGNMDEYTIEELFAQGAPIGGFGVGTRLDTSADGPYLDSAYKLMEYAGKPRLKKSEGKATLPGRKQVFRQYDANEMVKDILAIEGDEHEGLPLIREYMMNGKRVSGALSVHEIRDYTLEQIKTLPANLRKLQKTSPYPVLISESVMRMKEDIEKELGISG
jgi:nicotinate phosphoribosyltransferase